MKLLGVYKMNYYKVVLYSFIILILLSNLCVSPPPVTTSSSGSGGGVSVPHGSLSYIIDINSSEQSRNKSIELKFKLFNENKHREIPDVIVFGKINENFEVVGVSSHCEEMSWDQGHFEVKCSLGPGEGREYISQLRIKKDAELNYSKIINRSEISSGIYEQRYNKYLYEDGVNIAFNDGDIRLEIKKDESKCRDGIYILNNIPRIMSASATIISDLHLQHNNGSFLYKYRDNPRSIQVWLNVSGLDEEDETLNYTWTINPIGIIYQTNNNSYLINMTPLNGSVKYLFSVYATDNDSCRSNSRSAKILYNNITCDKFEVISGEIEENIKVKFISIVFLIFVLSLIFKFYPNETPLMDRWLDNTNKFRYSVLLVPIIIYILSIYVASKNYFWDQELPYYLTSLAWFEIIMFMIVFICVILFTHNCFSAHEIKYDRITAMLWLINLVGMTTLLVSLTLIIPFIEPNLIIEEHLQWFYSTMAQVFASILAIVAVFYTALPNKNIISINLKEKRIEYNHPLILRRFITIYGLILGFVLLGLSSGVHMEFPTYIEVSYSNLTNIYSIILFEITLLMIPPAISSLYTLIRITAFTGTVNIKSRPSASKIYLDGYDTDLITPTKLMLRDAQYDLSFKMHYIHSWNEISRGNDKKFRDFLKCKLGINWVETAKIERLDAGRTVVLYNMNNNLSLKLDKSESVVVLELDDGKTYRLIPKMENDVLNIYYTNYVELFVNHGTEKEYFIDVLKLEQDSDSQNIYDYLVSSKYIK